MIAKSAWAKEQSANQDLQFVAPNATVKEESAKTAQNVTVKDKRTARRVADPAKNEL
ncbi:MAG: hypothetical protein ACLP5V_02185 [Candidatus Bathyarchaeia archaeon]